jgi:hypothetical protein
MALLLYCFAFYTPVCWIDSQRTSRLIDSACARMTGTRTHVAVMRTEGLFQILRVSLTSFISCGRRKTARNLATAAAALLCPTGPRTDPACNGRTGISLRRDNITLEPAGPAWAGCDSPPRCSPPFHDTFVYQKAMARTKETRAATRLLVVSQLHIHAGVVGEEVEGVLRAGAGRKLQLGCIRLQPRNARGWGLRSAMARDCRHAPGWQLKSCGRGLLRPRLRHMPWACTRLLAPFTVRGRPLPRYHYRDLRHRLVRHKQRTPSQDTTLHQPGGGQLGSIHRVTCCGKILGCAGLPSSTSRVCWRSSSMAAAPAPEAACVACRRAHTQTCWSRARSRVTDALHT